MIDNEFVSLSLADRVATISINREQALNALNAEVLAGLSSAIAALRERCLGDSAYDECRAVLLRGSGDKAFVAGADIKLMHKASRGDVEKFTQLGQRVMRELENLPLPVIAVVDGFAIGGGFELALACDMIITTERAKLGAAEVSLGLIPGFGGTQRLTKRCGPGTAKRLIFTAENVGGEEALRLGIADWFVDSSELDEKLSSICKTITAKGPLAIAASKRAIQEGYIEQQGKALEKEVEEFLKVIMSKDGDEGLSAFVEKRKAEFKGR